MAFVHSGHLCCPTAPVCSSQDLVPHSHFKGLDIALLAIARPPFGSEVLKIFSMTTCPDARVTQVLKSDIRDKRGAG